MRITPFAPPTLTWAERARWPFVWRCRLPAAEAVHLGAVLRHRPGEMFIDDRGHVLLDAHAAQSLAVLPWDTDGCLAWVGERRAVPMLLFGVSRRDWHRVRPVTPPLRRVESAVAGGGELAGQRLTVGLRGST